uniref:PGG domain-containing protein n=2 Tax=Triticum urartu TaxID=4572 RepID=A0A8R7QV28_TRIUA
MLLATLVVTITYQAGLDLPGGLWLDDRDGQNIGHPVLQTTHPTRYRVFFYSNSAAFVTSLVVIMMLQSKFLLNRHTLEATLVLDLFGLITAYGAGSTREVTQSIYIVALAGIVLVYVIVHITIRDHDAELVDDEEVKHLDDKRKVLLLVAVLAATLTYQAGLTPPGGFWLADDRELGHRAGFPILLDNYTRRYNTFFYCNAASFMASVTLILLLVNPKLYRQGIRCRALYVCMLVGMFGLMGAYAAGSSRNLKTSVYVLTLVGAVLAFIASLLAIFLLGPYLNPKK